jgi:hypothetical protein
MAYQVEAEADDASTTTFGFNLALVEPWRTQVGALRCDMLLSKVITLSIVQCASWWLAAQYKLMDSGACFNICITDVQTVSVGL